MTEVKALAEDITGHNGSAMTPDNVQQILDIVLVSPGLLAAGLWASSL